MFIKHIIHSHGELIASKIYFNFWKTNYLCSLSKLNSLYGKLISNYVLFTITHMYRVKIFMQRRFYNSFFCLCMIRKFIIETS